MLDKIKLVWSKTNRWHRIILLFLIVESRWIPGGQVGFQCADPALSHPFTGDTVTSKWLFGVSIFMPLIVLLLIERTLYEDDKSNGRAKKQALWWYREYLFGFMINLTMIEVLKLIVGSPRPHFFNTCMPVEADTCTGSEFVPSYTCKNSAWHAQSDRSFPSGHTSLSLHAGLFMAYYLHRRVPYRLSKPGALLAAQIACVSGAILCGLSRITDRRHHWWDVLAGVVIGALVLFYTIVYLCKNFQCGGYDEANKITVEENADTKDNCNRQLLNSAAT